MCSLLWATGVLVAELCPARDQGGWDTRIDAHTRQIREDAIPDTSHSYTVQRKRIVVLQTPVLMVVSGQRCAKGQTDRGSNATTCLENSAGASHDSFAPSCPGPSRSVFLAIKGSWSRSSRYSLIRLNQTMIERSTGAMVRLMRSS